MLLYISHNTVNLINNAHEIVGWVWTPLWQVLTRRNYAVETGTHFHVINLNFRQISQRKSLWAAHTYRGFQPSRLAEVFFFSFNPGMSAVAVWMSHGHQVCPDFLLRDHPSYCRLVQLEATNNFGSPRLELRICSYISYATDDLESVWDFKFPPLFFSSLDSSSTDKYLSFLAWRSLKILLGCSAIWDFFCRLQLKQSLNSQEWIACELVYRRTYLFQVLLG